MHLLSNSPRIYPADQIEPGSLKNFTAQLKEGAGTARLMRPQFFCRHSRLTADFGVQHSQLVWTVMSDFPVLIPPSPPIPLLLRCVLCR